MVMRVQVRLNPDWNDEDDNSFTPWGPGFKWEPIATGQTAPNASFTINGTYYFVPSDDREYALTSYEMLEVRWPNKSGRAVFGYAVRKTDSAEIIAVIHQAFGWSWAFKIKYEPEILYTQNPHKNGWVYENLLKNTINTVMYWLLA